jgi:hypothetical protein
MHLQSLRSPLQRLGRRYGLVMLLLILCAALFGYLRFVDGQSTVGGWLTTRAGGKTAAALLLTDSDLAANPRQWT